MVEFKDQELAHIFFHELVHVRRRDVLINWLWIFLQAWHWFNPLLWLALRRLRDERELVCDGAALSLLNPEERSGYGATLLRLVTTEALPAPSLAPVLTRQDNLERRIRMIKAFTPKSSRTLVAAALLALVLAGWTFTRAADPPAAPAGAAAVSPARIASDQSPPVAPPDAAQKRMMRERRERVLQVLEKETSKLQTHTQVQKRRLDELKVMLASAESEEQSGRSSQPSLEILRSLEKARIEAQAEHARMATLYNLLTNASRTELRHMMTTAVPDQRLDRMLEERANAEQKLAELMEKFGEGHVETKQQIRQLERIHQQIETRMEGMLAIADSG